MIHVQRDESLANVIVNAFATAAPPAAVALHPDATGISPASVTITANDLGSITIQNPQDNILYIVSFNEVDLEITTHSIVG
ncbi:hypothetical protein FS827_19465 [Agrobacterium vitis]|uniref:hypothetical protein n=1 Tax=Allorhizobium ampelinum TaxID=3025782 RepID=UPI001F3BB745|nr:hypothetical protein [Allorhizobium ampelinum]MCF1463490.1 hypothetical protein [Allorhizobium ampelinum]